MNGTYGVVRPSLINVEQDVEIWYRYTPTRNNEDEQYRRFRKVDNPTSMLDNSVFETDDSAGERDNRLPGMYELSLPVDIFGRTGFYTVFIKPSEFYCDIKDIGTLSAYPDIKGIVVDINTTGDNSTMFENDNLIGYRVEYYEDSLRQDYYRIITSNNRCEPVSQNLTSANTNSNGYRFNDSGTLSFLTVTPSTSPSYKSNQTPFIGNASQRIIITNTKFDPIMIEIEMVEHDMDTLSTMLEGDQIRSLDKGLVTTYNENGEIYHQAEYYTVKSTYNTTDLYEVRKRIRDSFDNSANYNELINS